MKISVFGLGYVGCVTASCLADAGHQVIGVDIKPEKVSALNQGESLFFEPGLSEIISRCIDNGTFRATVKAEEGVQLSDIALVCVGTPSDLNGSINLNSVIKVCEEIGAALNKKSNYFTVAIRSTMLPGTSLKHCIPALERYSRKRVGIDFGYCVNPEFLREGNAISDFHSPPHTIIGELNEQSGEMMADLWSFVPATLYRVPLGVGEMVKYASNEFHALKIVFANEIGCLCSNYGIDSQEVMRIFVSDTKLNISARYLRPGNAFGGSCLGKDLRGLQFAAEEASLNLPLLNAVIPSNEAHIERIVDLVLKSNPQKVCFVGLSFKSGTDDMRESTSIRMIERCFDQGIDVKVFDPDLQEPLSDTLDLSGEAQWLSKKIRFCLQLNFTDALDETEVVLILKAIDRKNYSFLREWSQPGRVIIDVEQLLENAAEELACDVIGLSGEQPDNES